MNILLELLLLGRGGGRGKGDEEGGEGESRSWVGTGRPLLESRSWVGTWCLNPNLELDLDPERMVSINTLITYHCVFLARACLLLCGFSKRTAGALCVVRTFACELRRA